MVRVLVQSRHRPSIRERRCPNVAGLDADGARRVLHGYAAQRRDLRRHRPAFWLASILCAVFLLGWARGIVGTDLRRYLDLLR